MVGKQELLAAYKACRFFHNIIYRCKILICCDCKNITSAKTKHTNLRVLHQCITLDQNYGAIFKHLANQLNFGTNGLRCITFQPSSSTKFMQSMNLIVMTTVTSHSYCHSSNCSRTATAIHSLPHLQEQSLHNDIWHCHGSYNRQKNHSPSKSAAKNH